MKELLNRLGDKLWLRLEKNPSGRTGTYVITVVLPWVAIGMLLGVGIIAIGMAEGLFAVIFLAFIASSAVLVARADYKQGYADAIQCHYLKRREARMEKIANAQKENVE